MTLYISDQADEFRIEISGRFSESAVDDAETAWKAALLENKLRRISVDITQMTGYDRAGHLLLREIQGHGTHIVAGTPRSLFFLNQISGPLRPLSASQPEEASRPAKRTSNQVLAMPPRAIASGE